MLSLPNTFLSVMAIFALVFSWSVWLHAKVLLTGAILAPGTRTVTSILRVMATLMNPTFKTIIACSIALCGPRSRTAGQLLRLLIAFFVPWGPVVVELDETIERRRGDHIQSKGIYHDPVRSSRSHVVKVSGLRWLCAMLLTPIPWTQRGWALPFLTVLCPSERFHEQRGRRHQPLAERSWQVIRLVVRWLPGRSVVFVADTSYAVLELLAKVSHLCRASLITRLRLDAALYDPPPERQPGQKG